MATVSGGRIVGVGPGATTVSLEHSGQTQTVAVTVRRRTHVSGEARVETVDGGHAIDSLWLSLNGSPAGSTGTSNAVSSLRVRFLRADIPKVAVEPGEQRAAVNIDSKPSELPTYTVRWTQSLQLVDSDTSEVLSTIELGPETVKATSDPQVIEWTFTVPTFTS